MKMSLQGLWASVLGVQGAQGPKLTSNRVSLPSRPTPKQVMPSAFGEVSGKAATPVSASGGGSDSDAAAISG